MLKRKREKEYKILPRHSERVVPEEHEVDAEDISTLTKQVERLALLLEKSNFADYVQMTQNPWRLMFSNLLAGIARGLGVAIGFTILAAILVYLLNSMVNLPVIGDFIADIVRIVQSQLHTPTLP